MKILIVDNYDSFTYNLYHYCLGDGREVSVIKNDIVSDDDLDHCDKIILSPGPGLPSDAGRMPEIINRYSGVKPILGVCLGLQGIAEAFGGSLRNLPHVLHGQSSTCIKTENEDLIFDEIPDQFQVGHYHSWVVDENNLPAELLITAASQEGLIMALKHRDLNVRGVQFHPESIMTPEGKKMIENWLNLC